MFAPLDRAERRLRTIIWMMTAQLFVSFIILIRVGLPAMFGG